MARPVVVVKVGSSLLVDGDGALSEAFLDELVGQVLALRERGHAIVIVSSGAVAVGMDRLGLAVRPRDVPTLQACAACGQAALTEAYASRLATQDVACAQVLLNRRDVIERGTYLNVRNTLGRLLDLGVVPVVNENDTTSVSELSFGDNDLLGAIVGILTHAERYVVLTDVDGLYDANPASDPSAARIPVVRSIDDGIWALAGDAGSKVGTGGMRSKLAAARAAMAAGMDMVIASGRQPGSLVASLGDEVPGTLFAGGTHPREGARKLWIGVATVPAGALRVDAGAARALRERGASLLPAGVAEVWGEFRAGDVVSVEDGEGRLLGRGVARYGAAELAKVKGLSLDVIARFLPERAGEPAIHRDELLVF